MSIAVLKLAFMGTPDFAVPALDALVKAGHEIVCVYTQPPRPAGRGKQLRQSPVHRFAEEHGLVVRTPANFKNKTDVEAFATLDVDACVVVAYGLILPQAVLDAPRLGCFNIHASLLPRWRGAAPIQRAILEGDTETGISIMQMDAGLDTGPVLASATTPITPAMTASDLHDTLCEMGATLMTTILADVAAGKIEPKAQPQAGVTFAPKVDKAETKIDWDQSAENVARQVRGFYPAAWFMLAGERVRALGTEPIDGSGKSGQVLDNTGALVVACGNDALAIYHLQRAGKGAMDWEDFKRGNPVDVGTTLA